MPRLRDRPDDLFALISSASEDQHIPPEFVEKDFWVTELLRAAVAAAQSDSSLVIFKGGTSLSKAFRLIERFSEDVDVLLVPPESRGPEARHKILKRICASVGNHLGVDKGSYQVQQSETGIKRNVRFPYPRRFNSAAVEEGVLLEMGVRGGPHPHHRVALQSIVAEYALTQGSSLEDFEEFSPLDVDVLAPERTLVEKLALLHYLASNFAEDKVRNDLRQSGRHYYDIYKLLGHDPTLRAIEGERLVADLAADVAAHSKKYDLPFTLRPDRGYASSPAFDPSHPCQEVIKPAYTDARRLVYGQFPSLEDCLGRIRNSAKQL